MMCVGFLNFIFFFQIHLLNIEIHNLQSDSNNIRIYLIFFFSQFYAKLSDYRAVELSIGIPIGNPDTALFLGKASFHWNLGYTYIES